MIDVFKKHGNTMTNIVIVGYPKSGNTWVTQLVAELVKCPAIGFWDSDHNDSAQEGLDRKSEFQCFKSHHQLHELRGNRMLSEKRIIYVIRDPRDIAISGAYYFSMERWPSIAKLFGRFPKGRGFYSNIINPLITPRSYRIKQMVHAVLYGSKYVHHWVRIPWETHYKPYLENKCFFVKYEDLLDAPAHECNRILGYLGLDRQDTHIREAIERQSFKNKKEAFLKNNEIHKADLLRVGKSGQWRQELSGKQKDKFIKILSEELRQFAYPTDSNI